MYSKKEVKTLSYVFLLLMLYYTCVSVRGMEDFQCLIKFPESFYVSTGTTVSGINGFPVAQSGALYVNDDEGKVRIDQFYLGRQHTFIVDEKTHKAYVYYKEEAGIAENAQSNVKCNIFNIREKVRPLCVSTHFTEKVENEIVRSSMVDHNVGYDRHEGELLQIDYYVANAKITNENVRHSSEVVNSLNNYEYNVPWRIVTRYKPASELHEIAGAPVSMPNWRYYGYPMYDEIVPFKRFGDKNVYGNANNDENNNADEEVQDILPWLPEHDVIIVDFYNFVPTAPQSVVFTIPDECQKEEKFHSSAERFTEGNESVSNANKGNCSSNTCKLLWGKLRQLTLTGVQRFLIGWSYALELLEIDVKKYTESTPEFMQQSNETKFHVNTDLEYIKSKK